MSKKSKKAEVRDPHLLYSAAVQSVEADLLDTFDHDDAAALPAADLKLLSELVFNP